METFLGNGAGDPNWAHFMTLGPWLSPRKADEEEGCGLSVFRSVSEQESHGALLGLDFSCPKGHSETVDILQCGLGISRQDRKTEKIGGGGLRKRKSPPTSGFCLGITEMTDPVTYPQRIILLFLREKCCGDDWKLKCLGSFELTLIILPKQQTAPLSKVSQASSSTFIV